MFLIGLTAAMVGWQTAPVDYVSTGTVAGYRPWDKSSVPYARYAGRWRVKPTPRDLVCAHRTLPFGTILRIKPPHRPAGVCVVLDRGPWGFCEEVPGERHVFMLSRWHRLKHSPRCRRGYRWIVTTRSKGRHGYYRCEVDAAMAVHEMMGTRGWVKARIERLRGRKIRRVIRIDELPGYLM